MKKILAIALMMVLALNAKADDIFATGYYVQNGQKVAAVYRNGEIIYTVSHEGMNATPKTIACDANKNIYWMINIYQGTSFKYTEVWKNDLLYVSTQGMSGVRIIDIYCLDDTMFYAGSYTNEGGITVAAVWKGTDFTMHWQLGDGEHTSFIYDAEVNPNTGVPYFCGYVNDEKLKATVWENNETLYSYDLSYVTESSASYISIDNDNIYTLGYHEAYDYDLPVIWKNGDVIKSFDEDVMVDLLCAFQGKYYYCYTYPHEMYYCLCSNNSIVLQFPFNGSAGASKICKDADDIYVVGLLDNKGCIWKNFQVLQQPENCAQLLDMTVVETSNPLDNYYGYLCQPDSAIIELDPNSYLGYEYGDDFYAKFAYHPNGLLNTQYTYSISSDAFNTYIATYHYFLFYYDSEYHVIQQNDDYYIGGDEPFINHYIYDNGLLMTFTRHFDNYHENIMVLYDSISYAYDEQRRLQVEQRFNRLPLPEHAATVKNYEYLENKIIINTTDYSSGEWLSRETRTFNEDSLLVSSQTEKHNDSTVLVTYGYDEQGHQTSILTQKRNNGVWENQKLVQYNFNPYGRLTLAEIKLWQDDAFVNAHRAVYELNEMGYPATVTFEKWDGEVWVNGVWQSDFYLYDEDHLKQQNDMFYGDRNCIHKIELNYLVTDNPREPFLPDNSEWYYEILNDDGSITYQHLEVEGDTVVGNQRPKIIVRSNTQYDKDTPTEVTHEYVYEENGIVYWWNKDLEEFTTLYNLNAEAGDEWTIKVGYDSLIMHVDGVDSVEYEDRTFRVLHVSDPDDLFSGDIVCGVGHLTSFFPERLMRHTADYTVNGMRCYWVDGNLFFKTGEEDCDAVYSEIHGVGEDGPSTPSTSSGTIRVYPNPANNVLFVETHGRASLSNQTYHITNLVGQTLMSGVLAVRLPQCDSPTNIDVSSLPAGMYFISVSGQTAKFVVR